MDTVAEHNARAPAASNLAVIRAFRGLVAALHRAAAGDSAAAVLEAAASAIDAERAFVLESHGRHDEPRVRASACLRADGDTTPSRTVARRALAARKPIAAPDLLRDSAMGDGDSVRALGLRAVLAAPVPSSAPPAVLVLDSREPGDDVPFAAETVHAFAALLGLVLARPGPERPGGTEVEPPPGRSPAYAAAVETLRLAAPTRLPVLIEGETGTGKEGLARWLHAAGPRRTRPLVALNCAAIPESLLEAELFGSDRGSFTGAERDRPGLFRAAHGGTLFLDEVGDMPAAMQAKLLRAIQERRIRPVGGGEETPVDVRVVSATHRDLDSLARRGAFREDLLYRLAVVRVRVPPLRERPEDVAAITATILDRLHREAALPRASASPEALARLAAHPWPGNIRELEGVLARALLGCRDGEIAAADLAIPPPRSPAAPSPGLEARMIAEALAEARGRIGEAASRIGWTRQKLRRRVRALGLEPP